MTRRTRAWLFIAASALLVVAIALTVFGWGEDTDGNLPAQSTASLRSGRMPEASTANQAVSADLQAGLVIGEYRPNAAGLPPLDASLAMQIPALRDAASRGNATAACRLAVIGTRCNTARTFRVSLTAEQSVTSARRIEADLLQQYAGVSLDRLPERYRAYAQRRIVAEATQGADWVQELQTWARRCADAPPIPQDELLAALRQAALAGEPTSMVNYAAGLWMAEISTINIVNGFGGNPSDNGWLRSPGFDRWRREAAAVRRAGLERGDPEMLWVESTFVDVAAFRPLEPADPVESAAALRAYAALIGGHVPESTATLGLSPQQSAEADRLSEAWAARGRERGRRADDVTDGLIARSPASCE